jgi:hypothetical protein
MTSSSQPSPLLPRSGWQNEQALLKQLVKAKQALDAAELTAALWGIRRQPQTSSHTI